MKFCSWVILTVLVTFVGAYALLFFAIDGFGEPETKQRYEVLFWSSRLHIYLGGVALFIVPVQLLAGIRNKFLAVHKNLGYVYFLSVFLSSVSGFYLAWHSSASLIGDIGFAVLSTCWLVTAVFGYVMIKQGNVQAHQRWMLRNIALTFAAISLRLLMPLLIGVIGLNHHQAFDVVAWACWLPQLLLLEIFLRRRLQ